MISNKIQVIYRLSNKIVLMWPVRPNAGDTTKPTSFNVYWDTVSGGTYANLLGSVENVSSQSPWGNRSYHNKVVLTIIPEQVAGWDNEVVNYVKIKAVIGGVEQALEDATAIAPYFDGARRRYTEVNKTAMVGFNAEEDRYIPVSVDTDGKVETV